MRAAARPSITGPCADPFEAYRQRGATHIERYRDALYGPTPAERAPIAALSVRDRFVRWAATGAGLTFGVLAAGHYVLAGVFVGHGVPWLLAVLLTLLPYLALSDAVLSRIVPGLLLRFDLYQRSHPRADLPLSELGLADELAEANARALRGVATGPFVGACLASECAALRQVVITRLVPLLADDD